MYSNVIDGSWNKILALYSTQGGRETAPHGWAEKGRTEENAPVWAPGQWVGWLHGGTILSIRKHIPKGSKALERHDKTTEAGRGAGQLGEDNQLKPDGNMPPVLIC